MIRVYKKDTKPKTNSYIGIAINLRVHRSSRQLRSWIQDGSTPSQPLCLAPTCSGKSQFVKRLLESREEMIDGAPENIILVLWNLPTSLR